MNFLFICFFLNNGLYLNENWNFYWDMGEVY